MSTREQILIASNATGKGHIPSSFSIVEILEAVYSVMKPEDIFILSKGHGWYALWFELAKKGLVSGNPIGTHPSRAIPGVYLSTGSLGHGLPVAVGVAIGLKIKKSNAKVYCLIGDGESNEGTIWEGVQVGVLQKLNNLIILYDANHSQSRCCQIEDPWAVFNAFGCDAYGVNGHHAEAIQSLIAEEPLDAPKVLICHTTKGYGCPTLEADPWGWHRRSPTDEELPNLIGELYA